MTLGYESETVQSPRPATSNTASCTAAASGETSPAAIGRRHFFGCRRSVLASHKSFHVYTAEVTRQKPKKPRQNETGAKFCLSAALIALRAKGTGNSTKTFLIQSRGRASRIRPVIMGRD